MKRCRYKFSTDFHHRVAQKNGGTDTFPVGNLVRVSKRQHMHYHALFGTKTPEEVALYLNRKWIDPRFLLIVIPNPNYPKN